MPLLKNNQLNENLYKTTKLALAALGFTGPANVDLIVDKEGNVYILEIGARIGATCLPDMVLLSTGVDLYDMQVKMGLNKTFLSGEYSYPLRNSGVRILTSKYQFISNFMT